MVRGLDGYLFIYPEVLCGFQAPPGAESRKIPVAHSEWETPLPIPNRAVKPLCADGTWGATSWESRSPPVLRVVARATSWRGLRALSLMRAHPILATPGCARSRLRFCSRPFLRTSSHLPSL